ncbi:hypothetical protein ACVMB0_000232 [Bradyrhizobium sp. USDA 4451]
MTIGPLANRIHTESQRREAKARGCEKARHLLLRCSEKSEAAFAESIMPDRSGQRGSWSGSVCRPSKSPPRSVSSSIRLTCRRREARHFARRSPNMLHYNRQSTTLESDSNASRARRASRHADAVVTVTGSVFAEKQLRPHRLGHSEERKAPAPSGGPGGRHAGAFVALSKRSKRIGRLIVHCEVDSSNQSA